VSKQVRVGILIGLSIVVVSTAPAMANITLTFEEFIGFDQAPIGTFYSGISFQAGPSGTDWLAYDDGPGGSGPYNSSAYPSGDGGGEYWIFGQVVAATALSSPDGDSGKIAFTNGDATFVELAYSSATQLYFEAYDAANNLMDSDTGAANLRFVNSNPNGPGTLHVDWNGTDHIAYVIVHDNGNQWVIDNLTTDATGITTSGVVPAPAAVWLGAAGLGLVGLIRRRFS